MNWFYESNGKAQGPVMESELELLWLNGLLSGATLVWREGLAAWTSAGEIWPALLNQKPESVSLLQMSSEATPEGTRESVAESPQEQGKKYYCETTDRWLDHPVEPAQKGKVRLHGLGYLMGGLVTAWAGVAWPLHQIKTGAASVMVPMKLIGFSVLVAIFGIYLICSGKSISHQAAAEQDRILHGSLTKVPLSTWLLIGFTLSVGGAVIWYIDAYFAKLGYR